jgi:predicted ATPase
MLPRPYPRQPYSTKYYQIKRLLRVHQVTLTNWHVITGAPCSGKSSVILALACEGFQVLHEAARDYIEEQLQQGRSMPQIKADEADFEQRILHRKIALEASLAPHQTVFLDRAIPDSIAYYRYAGIDPSEALHASRMYRYKCIFVFERLTFIPDAARSEDDTVAMCLHEHLVRAYRELGYDIIPVPLMPIADRVNFILAAAGHPAAESGFEPQQD